MDYLYQEELHSFFIEQEVPNENNVKRYMKMFEEMSSEKILSYIGAQTELPVIEAKNIPQFSSLSSIDGVLDIVYSSKNITYDEIGYYFFHDSSVVAQRKYGENHYKLAAIMGLTTWEKPFRVTDFGREYMLLNQEKKEIIFKKIILRIPIIQRILINSLNQSIRPLDILETYLSVSTAKRRHTNVHSLVEIVVQTMEEDIRIEINGNLNWK